MEEATTFEEVVSSEDEASDMEVDEGFTETSGSSSGSVETVYVVVEEDRPFMTTPLDDYSVTEGLLLLVFVLLLFRSALNLIARWF